MEASINLDIFMKPNSIDTFRNRVQSFTLSWLVILSSWFLLEMMVEPKIDVTP